VIEDIDIAWNYEEDIDSWIEEKNIIMRLDINDGNVLKRFAMFIS